ncbi:MAG: hotdog fold thioesterase [Candidatus Dormiibacterota bacterium]
MLSAQLPNPQFDRFGRTSMRYLAGIMLLRLQGLIFLALFLAVTMFSNVVGNLGVVPLVGRVAYLPALVLAMAAAGGLILGLTKWGQTSAVALYEGLLVAGGIAFAIVDQPGGGQAPAFRDPATIFHLLLLPIAVALVTYWPVLFAIRRGGLAALNQPVMPEYKEEEPPPQPPEVYIPQPREESSGLPERRGTGSTTMSSAYAEEAVAIPESTTGTPPMAPPPRFEQPVAAEAEAPPGDIDLNPAVPGLVAPAAAETGPTTPIWQEEPPEVPMSMEWLKLPGMLRMRSQVSGGFPPASFARLTGIRTVSLEPGEARVEMPVSDWLRNSTGLLSAGVIGYLADSPMGSAVFTELGPGQVITTSEMAVNYLRPVSRDATKLLAVARLVQIGRSYAFTEVTITDDKDKLVGHGTARNLLIEVSVPEGEFQAPPRQELKPGYVDPYLRPVRGEVLPPAIWTEKSGLEMQRMWLAGELPNSPLAELVGLRRNAVSEGSVTMTAPASHWLESPARRLYGGALALLADAGLTSAVQTTVPAGTAIAPLDIKLQFLRPVRANGRDLTIKADVVHRGRTLAAASAEVLIPGGKVAALATSTWLIVPDFSWATDPWVPTDQVRVTEDEADN